jgi:hypothetical protein
MYVSHAELQNPSVGYYLVPTILRQDGFRVRLYGPPREHAPAHVHVYSPGGSEAVFLLGDDRREPCLRDVVEMNRRDLARALRLVRENVTYLRACWRRIHGPA